MLSKKNKLITVALIFFLIFIHCNIVNATYISQAEYTDEYKEWLELPEEKRKQTIEPKMFDIIIENNSNKFFTKIKTFMSSISEYGFDLRDYISKNLQIRNQGNTNACWAFATLSSLETNLALKNNNKVYDYSESHMDYSTSQSFKDGKLNNGFTRQVSKGGNFQIGSAYLTNGQGAVLENEMPFISTKEDISIKDIQGKEAVTKVTDTEEFGTFVNPFSREELIFKMKEHIRSNGSISAGIHGAKLSENCYNNSNAAIFCSDKNLCKMDHNISIIGWDDTYSKDNFNNSEKIKNNGAWIIRNSWGDRTLLGKTKDLIEQLKTRLLQEEPEKCEEKGWYSVEDIPDELVIEAFENVGYIIDGEDIYMPIGDNGFMYVSYEDVNIYTQLFGIEKASENVDYDNIYQYNELGFNNILELGQNKMYVANVFNRDKTVNEVLTEVSLNVMQKVKCKVYVNSKNSSKNIDDLIEVELVDGKTETFDAGYHTIEFKNPISLTGSSFVVVIEIEAIDDDYVYCPTIIKTTNHYWDNVKVKENASYITYGDFFKQNEWIDTVTNAVNINAEPSNLTIKAFTREVEIIETPTPTATPTATIKPTSTPTAEPTTPTPTIKPTSIPNEEEPKETLEPTATATPTTKPTSTPTARPNTPTPTIKPTATTSNNSQILGSISTNKTESTMTSHSSLPYVGKTEIILGLIAILSINMIIVYKKYKKIY